MPDCQETDSLCLLGNCRIIQHASTELSGEVASHVIRGLEHGGVGEVEGYVPTAYGAKPFLVDDF